MYLSTDDMSFVSYLMDPSFRSVSHRMTSVALGLEHHELLNAGAIVAVFVMKAPAGIKARNYLTSAIDGGE